jgi:putative transposase
LTTGEIQQHLFEIYGTDVSRETISTITDQIVEELSVWQSRPLEPPYAELVIDCLVVKVRGGQAANRPV